MASHPVPLKSSIIFAILVVACLGAAPRAATQGADLKSKLEASYAFTKPTDDKSDIVTAGAVLILEKDKILMYPTTNSVVPQNTFKDGKLSAGAFAVHDSLSKFGAKIGHPGPSQTQVSTRYYVTGEKFWVTRIDYPQDGVVFYLFTDPVGNDNTRYDCTLKFVYPKGVQLTTDQVITLVGSVLKVQPDEDAKSGDQKGGDQPAQSGDQAAPADQQPAAADPAPAEPPQSVELGMTTDQVVAILGQPTKIVNVGPKQIYVYKDLKVTFIKGKVTDAS
jgi:hypothetical protein